MLHDAQHSTYHHDDHDDDPGVGEEDEMHVLHGGEWHRELIGTVAIDMTACEARYQIMFCPRRPPRLEGALCPVCFTPREVREATGRAAAQHQTGATIGPDLSDIPRNPRRRK